jgi:DNA polymerase-1
MPKDKRLILIDAHALIHRAYHALPATMSAPDGFSTNAIYGFTSVLIKVLKELKSNYVVAAFDRPEPTFRHEEFEDYKAQRPETASDLIEQIPRIKEILEVLGISVFEKAGFEADDIIGSLVKKFSGEFEIFIVTGDLDTLQLVGPNVKVYTLKKGVTETIIYDVKAVKGRFGLEPSQMVDFKGLRGDPSDNIPGVPGIGEKTAAALLQQFGTIERVYSALEKGKADIKEGVKKKLLENKDQAFFSKKLVVLRDDVPIKISVKDIELKHFNQDRIEAIFKEFGFFSILDRLSDLPHYQAKAGRSSGSKVKSEEINSASDLTSLKKFKEVVLVGGGDGLYVSGDRKSVLAVPRKLFPELGSLFSSDAVLKTGHDLKLVWRQLKEKENINLAGIEFDTMLAAYLLRSGRGDYSLERVVFGETGQMPLLTGPADEISYIWQLKEKFIPKLKEQELWNVFEKIEMPLVAVLSQMEFLGIKLDKDLLAELSQKTEKEIIELEKKIFKISGTEFNISSPKQLSEVLFEKLGLETKGLRKTPGGAISTQAGELDKLKGKNEIIDLILDYRELAKLKTTYIDALPQLVAQDNRLHTTFNQTGTATGRLSSENPNLQNIPARGDLAKQIRRAFVVEEGFELVSCDYSQIELRIAASIAGDEKMITAFKAGEDIHSRTASEIFNTSIKEVNEEMRRQAKVLNFGVLYGMGVRGFMEAAGVSKERARQFIDEYFHDFHGIAEYIKNIKEEAARNSFVKTLTGRRRLLPEIHSENQMLKSQAERMAINMPIQGTAADIMKLAMIEISKWLKENKLEEDIRMLLQVHDELIFEVKKDKLTEFSKIKDIMERAMKLEVPLKVDIKVGPNWSEMQKYA